MEREVRSSSKTSFAHGFGELLRQHRLAVGLTQETLAERARISLAAIGKLERGTRQRPHRATIGLLAEALGLSQDDRLELERAAERGTHGASEPAIEVQALTSLPLHFSSFVGRERDLAKVREMLVTHRLITLVGAGGVGKTRLAVRAAEQFIADNSTRDHLHNVWFVDLSSTIDAEATMSSIASSVGMEQCRSLDALIGYLRAERFLLMLDNCEHLVDEVARLAGELLRHCPNARILATSRQSLGVDGERIYRVPPLQVPMPEADALLSSSKALEFSAIRLFAERAEAADSRFELTDSIVPAVAEICRRLDGIALAIELAAARTNAFTTTTIARRLDEHFLLLVGGRQTLSRHKTMRTVFDWSYGLLDESERRVFRWLSVFVGGFTLELAMSFWSGEIEEASIVEIVASLVDKSLLQCDPYAEPARYRMLDSARQYASEKLHEHNEQNAAARAHANALLALALDVDSRLELTPDRVWDAYVERERDNFRAAFEWALGPHGDTDLASRMAGSKTAGSCGLQSGELRKWVSAALNVCTESTPSEVTAKLALAAARIAIAFGKDASASLAESRRALHVQKADDLRARAAAGHLVGLALHMLGRFDEAERVLREARAAARSSGAQFEYYSATNVLGAVRYRAGDVDEARTLMAEALQQVRAAGCARYVAAVTNTLAEIEFISGNVEKAVQLAEEALHCLRSRSDLLRLLFTLCNLSAYLIALGHYRKARDYAHEALRAARALGTTSYLEWIMQHLAAVAILSGDSGEHNTILRRAASILGFVDERRRSAHVREYTEQQEYDKMISALREVLDEDELTKFMAAGKEWSEDQAVAEALAI